MVNPLDSISATATRSLKKLYKVVSPSFTSDELTIYPGPRRWSQEPPDAHRHNGNPLCRGLEAPGSPVRRPALRLFRRRTVLSRVQPPFGLGLRGPSAADCVDHLDRAIAFWRLTPGDPLPARRGRSGRGGPRGLECSPIRITAGFPVPRRPRHARRAGK